MAAVFHVLELSGVLLQAVLVILLLGSLRRYASLFVYSVAQLATAVLEFLVGAGPGRQSEVFRVIYWSDEVILDFLRFVIVVVLVYKASESTSMKVPLKKILAAIIVAMVAAPFLFLNRPFFTTHWFNGASQMLNFGGAIVNLLLWTLLLGNKRRDPQLLLVSLGVGVAVTGAAVAWGLRNFIPQPYMWAPNLLLVLSYFAGVLTWCWAFRPAFNREQRAALSGV